MIATERSITTWSDDRIRASRHTLVDTEQSKWTFDPVRGQYYWHRFFAHQAASRSAGPICAWAEPLPPAPALCMTSGRRWQQGMLALPGDSGLREARHVPAAALRER